MSEGDEGIDWKEQMRRMQQERIDAGPRAGGLLPSWETVVAKLERRIDTLEKKVENLTDRMTNIDGAGSQAMKKWAEMTPEEQMRDLLERAEQCLRYKDPEGMAVADEISDFLYGRNPRYSNAAQEETQ